MEPVKKTPAIDNFIREALGIDRQGCISENVCTLCGDPVTPESFKDELSIREYKISGACQSCQDKVFGNGTDEPDES